MALMENEVTKVAVITGASSGIGRATALQFADEGYQVVLAARRIKELVTVGQECEALGVRAVVIALDTTDDQAMSRLADEAIEAFGQIDVWVNNAGVYAVGRFEDIPLADMRQLMDTNFFGYVHGSQAALRQFRRQEHGTLINISSINAAAPQPYISVYSASKAAVRAMDESIRMELRLEGLDKNIHVCTVMPASIDTNLFQNSANYTGKEIQALEPVYDPYYVARRIVKLARRPRRQIIIGPAGRFMALQNAHSPRMYEKQISSYTNKDLLGDEPVPSTTGNLYQSLPAHKGVAGGWRQIRTRGDRQNAAIGIGLLAAALAGAGLVFYRQQTHRS